MCNFSSSKDCRTSEKYPRPNHLLVEEIFMQTSIIHPKLPWLTVHFNICKFLSISNLRCENIFGRLTGVSFVSWPAEGKINYLPQAVFSTLLLNSLISSLSSSKSYYLNVFIISTTFRGRSFLILGRGWSKKREGSEKIGI